MVYNSTGSLHTEYSIPLLDFLFPWTRSSWLHLKSLTTQCIRKSNVTMLRTYDVIDSSSTLSLKVDAWGTAYSKESEFRRHRQIYIALLWWNWKLFYCSHYICLMSRGGIWENYRVETGIYHRHEERRIFMSENLYSSKRRIDTKMILGWKRWTINSMLFKVSIFYHT